MIPELGHFLLWLALGVSAVLGTMPLVGAGRNRGDWMALAAAVGRDPVRARRPRFVCLALAFVGNDFSVLYVATNSNRSLPTHYRFAAVWGGHEGSMLLWTLMLAVWTVAVARFSAHLPDKVMARILAVMGWLSFGFLLFMLVTSNPFDRLLPTPADGRDLNPLLQDPGMVIHPPMLYMGYVGLSVAFSFAVAALIGGNLDATWARWTRPWTPPPGSSSPSASPSAAAGPTTSSAGAAGGSGTRSRTPRSCPGWWRPR
jgi:cytochrome c-type biogenesis protein CcmF